MAASSRSTSSSASAMRSTMEPKPPTASQAANLGSKFHGVDSPSLNPSGYPRHSPGMVPGSRKCGTTAHCARLLTVGVKCDREYIRNRAECWLHTGNHVEPGEEIRNRAYFQKSGSKVCAGSVGFEIALPTLPYGAVSTPRPSMAPLLPTESQPSFANSVRSTFAFVWSLSLGSRVL